MESKGSSPILPIQPKEHENREEKPLDFFVYATEHIQTKEDHFPSPDKLATGYSSPLENPIRTVNYHWNGQWYGDDYGSSSNANNNLEVLAQNLSTNYFHEIEMGRQKAEPDTQSKSPLHLSFEPSDTIEQQFQEQYSGEVENNTIRGLTEAEQKQFLNAFKAANQEAAAKKKSTKLPPDFNHGDRI